MSAASPTLAGPPPRRRLPIATALRRTLEAGYTRADLRADLLAGLVVGIVALPLSMALAIAVGVPPQHGLYTAIFGGGVCALLGGSKHQVTGPTAAFVVILAPIVTRFGISGLLTAGFMAGAILLALGFARLGRLIQYVPYPVVTGFTTGIATVIAALQLKDAAGLQTGPMPEHFVDKLIALWSARTTASLPDLAIFVVTLALLLLLPRVIKRVPAPLLALVGMSALTAGAQHFFPGLAFATVGQRFQSVVDGVVVPGIPRALPMPGAPWGSVLPSFALVRELIQPAIAIALLGAIESLLSATIADGMTGKKHDPDAELVGLGAANLIAPIFGGIAATGALARTATNVRSGARSPFASLVHAAIVLGAMLVLAPLCAYLPMAALAALLMLVAWNMSEVRQFASVIRVAPKSDVFVLITCFSLTVLFDMVVAVTVGFLAAAILFMRRMSELTESRLRLDSMTDGAQRELPPEVVLYEINGPLFFGAAQTAMNTLEGIRGTSFRTLVLDLSRVPVIDATGFVALESAIRNVTASGRSVIVAGPLPRPRQIFDRAALEKKYAGLRVVESVDAALAVAHPPSVRPKPS